MTAHLGCPCTAQHSDCQILLNCCCCALLSHHCLTGDLWSKRVESYITLIYHIIYICIYSLIPGGRFGGGPRPLPVPMPLLDPRQSTRQQRSIPLLFQELGSGLPVEAFTISKARQLRRTAHALQLLLDLAGLLLRCVFHVRGNGLKAAQAEIHSRKFEPEWQRFSLGLGFMADPST